MYCVQLMHRRTGRLIGSVRRFATQDAVRRCVAELRDVFLEEIWDVCVWQTSAP